MENCGKVCWDPKLNFSCVDFREITAPEFISEPVAGSVNTHPNGTADLTVAPFERISHASSP